MVHITLVVVYVWETSPTPQHKNVKIKILKFLNSQALKNVNKITESSSHIQTADNLSSWHPTMNSLHVVHQTTFLSEGPPTKLTLEPFQLKVNSFNVNLQSAKDLTLHFVSEHFRTVITSNFYDACRITELNHFQASRCAEIHVFVANFQIS